MEFNVKTTKPQQIIDITKEVATCVSITEGICTIFVKHTTAALYINENADSDMKDDILTTLDKLVPNNGSYAHANAEEHIKATLLGCSVTVPISDKKLVLGTWQGIMLAEFSGPRNRTVFVQCVGR